MDFLRDGLRDALHLILHGDHDVLEVLRVTIEIALASTALALAIGLPLGVALGLGRFRGRRLVLAGVNAGLALPPVVVGLVAALLLFRGSLLGGLNLIYTVRGVILAQTI